MFLSTVLQVFYFCLKCFLEPIETLVTEKLIFCLKSEKHVCLKKKRISCSWIRTLDLSLEATLPNRCTSAATILLIFRSNLTTRSFFRIIESDKTEKPFHHVCTSAILCPFYRIFDGIAGISVQLGGSILGLIINLTLLLGIFHSASWALLLWLVCYVFAIIGCLSLFAVVINVLIIRSVQARTNCGS